MIEQITHMNDKPQSTVYGMLLAQLLTEIEAADMDYPKRYGLVLRAMGAAVKAGFDVGIRVDPVDSEWPIVYIELPDGQVSWHMPQHGREWDGHDTITKYERCRAFAKPYDLRQGAT